MVMMLIMVILDGMLIAITMIPTDNDCDAHDDINA